MTDKAHFTADLDEMQAVIDGELHDAIAHFSKINANVQGVVDPHQWMRPDNLCDLGGPFAVALFDLLAVYKTDFDDLVNQLQQLGADLQHVVDVYSKAEGVNVQHIKAAGATK